MVLNQFYFNFIGIKIEKHYIAHNNCIKQNTIMESNKSEITQTKITDFFKGNREASLEKNISKKVYGYCKKTGSWHCTECGQDMGSQNPRQLCGKTYCYWS